MLFIIFSCSWFLYIVYIYRYGNTQNYGLDLLSAQSKQNLNLSVYSFRLFFFFAFMFMLVHFDWNTRFHNQTSIFKAHLFSCLYSFQPHNWKMHWAKIPFWRHHWLSMLASHIYGLLFLGIISHLLVNRNYFWSNIFYLAREGTET